MNIEISLLKMFKKVLIYDDYLKVLINLKLKLMIICV